MRNMGFYNFPLHLLRMAREAEGEVSPFMTPEEAVHSMTGELATWFGLDAGTLEVGDRADIAIIDPDGLDDALDGYHEAPIPVMGVNRMVRRNDRAVAATIIGGRVAFQYGAFSDDFGQSRYGRFLGAGVRERTPVEIQLEADKVLAKTG